MRYIDFFRLFLLILLLVLLLLRGVLYLSHKQTANVKTGVRSQLYHCLAVDGIGLVWIKAHESCTVEDESAVGR